jgi:hypothetical protein
MLSNVTFLPVLTAALRDSWSLAPAYVDPGSGTLILQLLAAALIGALFYVRKVIAWFRGLKDPKVRASSNQVHAVETGAVETGTEREDVSRPVQG